MLLDFGVGYVFCFFRKAEHNILKKVSWPKFCNIFLVFVVFGPVYQQINLVSSNKMSKKMCHVMKGIVRNKIPSSQFYHSEKQ